MTTLILRTARERAQTLRVPRGSARLGPGPSLNEHAFVLERQPYCRSLRITQESLDNAGRLFCFYVLPLVDWNPPPLPPPSGGQIVLAHPGTVTTAAARLDSTSARVGLAACAQPPVSPTLTSPVPSTSASPLTSHPSVSSPHRLLLQPSPSPHHPPTHPSHVTCAPAPQAPWTPPPPRRASTASCSAASWQGGIQNNHSTDVESPPPPSCVCMKYCIHPEGKSRGLVRSLSSGCYQ